MIKNNNTIKGIALLMVIVFLTVACSSGENPINTKTTTSKLEVLVEEVIIEEYSLNIMIPVFPTEVKYVNIDSWEEMIREKYNININIEHIPQLDYYQYSDISGNYFVNVVKKNEYEGFIKLVSFLDQLVVVLKEKDLILPLDEYLNNNEIFKSFPKDMQERYKMLDGTTWAIPDGYSYNISGRVYRTDWLSNINEDKPSTLEEFYIVAKGFTYGDPNNSGKDDTFGLAVHANSPLTNLKDIFYANGQYVDRSGYQSYSFDRITNSFEDAFAKDNILDTLNYIDALNQEDIINKVQYFRIDDFIQSKTDGSCNRYIIDEVFTEEYDVIWFLKGSNTEYLTPIITGAGNFVLSKNTQNPQLAVDTFINTFYGSSEGYYSAYLGLDGIDYTVSGNSVVPISGKNEKISVIGTYYPYLLTNGYSIDDSTNAEYNYNIEEKIKAVEYLESEGNMLFYVNYLDGPFDFSHGTNFSATWYLSKMLKKQISPEELLEAYITSAKKANIMGELDDLNAQIGKTTSYGY